MTLFQRRVFKNSRSPDWQSATFLHDPNFDSLTGDLVLRHEKMRNSLLAMWALEAYYKLNQTKRLPGFSENSLEHSNQPCKETSRTIRMPLITTFKSSSPVPGSTTSAHYAHHIRQIFKLPDSSPATFQQTETHRQRNKVSLSRFILQIDEK